MSIKPTEDAWTDYGSDFVLIAEGKPPPRIELARERILICRLYLGLMRTITDDYGAEFVAHSDSLAYRTIGIYVFLRTVMCSPVRASQIAGSGLPARPSPLSGKCPGGKDFLLIRPRTRGQSLQRPRSSTLAC
jgi:hypothetical protein